MRRRKRRTARTVLVLLLLLAVVLPFAWKHGQVALRKAAHPLKFEDTVYRYAEEFSLSPSLVFAVIRTESKFDPEAQSAAGAKGLMQLMDNTYEWVGKSLLDDPQPMENICEPETNVRFGCRLLAYLLKRFENTETALAAYNAGVGRVAAWLKNPSYSEDGVTLKSIPLDETRQYVERVTKAQEAYQTLYNVDREES